jgi:hypothetical protein
MNKRWRSGVLAPNGKSPVQKSKADLDVRGEIVNQDLPAKSRMSRSPSPNWQRGFAVDDEASLRLEMHCIMVARLLLAVGTRKQDLVSPVSAWLENLGWSSGRFLQVRPVISCIPLGLWSRSVEKAKLRCQGDRRAQMWTLQLSLTYN